MKWSLTLILSLFVAVTAMAIGVDDQYVAIYDLIQQGDTVSKTQPRVAAEKYLEAQTQLKSLQNVSPNWNPEVVSYRLNYLADKLKELSKFIPQQPSANPASTNVPPTKPSAKVLEEQLGELQQQVAQLTADKTKLEAKLKEALSAQPAAVDPQELAKAEQKIAALTKERDLLAVTLEQEKQKSKGASKSGDVTALRQQLAAAHDELAAVKKQSAVEHVVLQARIAHLEDVNAKPQVNPAESETVTALTRERNKLKKQVDSLTRDVANAEAKRDEDVLAAQAEVAKLRAQMKDALAQQGQKSVDQAHLTAVPDAGSNQKVEQMKEKILQLSDRLAVYEAQRVAPSAEELALLKKADKQPAPAPKHVHSFKELSDNARSLMEDGDRLYAIKDYAGAEAKFRKALADDPNNVYVVAYIASVQMSAEHFDDCEKSVKRALAIDPDDAGSLYILGKLLLRQDKVDEALDVLSHSARLKQTAQTENALGSALSRKGMREPAETALRKALQIEPDYPDAHHNLALVYATDTPPSIELAKWHYKKALDAGYPKDAELEKLLK